MQVICFNVGDFFQYIICQQIAPCYQTKFAPPRKQSKQSKTLSDNIKRFLARREEEEKQKVLEEKRKKEVIFH